MKTVPIWCAVFNRLLFPSDEEAGRLYTPPKRVSRSEHAQIEQRLDGFVTELKKLQLDVAELREKISKPLRPLWFTRESELPLAPPEYEDFHPIVLCTSSRRVIGGEVSEGGYIQGAGDDAEGWSHGLTPALFWQHKDELNATSEEDLPDLIASLLKISKHSTAESNVMVIKSAPWLFIGALDCLDPLMVSKFDAIITVSQQSVLSEIQLPSKKHLHLECRERKLGSRDLRTQLPQLRPFIESLHTPSRIFVCDSAGTDLAAGVALALLCLYADEAGKSCRITYRGYADKSRAIHECKFETEH
jgi:tRNA A64-2'-O-ribosylphosphate transferase